MMRRYADAIRTFSNILLYVQRTKQMFQVNTSVSLSLYTHEVIPAKYFPSVGSLGAEREDKQVNWKFSPYLFLRFLSFFSLIKWYPNQFQLSVSLKITHRLGQVVPERPDQQADGPDVRPPLNLPRPPPTEDRRICSYNAQVTTNIFVILQRFYYLAKRLNHTSIKWLLRCSKPETTLYLQT